MRTIRHTAQFKKDFKLAQRRGRNIKLLKEVLSSLANDQPLDVRYRDHALMGRYSGTRECHVQPDWLLIYRLTDEELVLVRLGSHADLF